MKQSKTIAIFFLLFTFTASYGQQELKLSSLFQENVKSGIALIDNSHLTALTIDQSVLKTLRQSAPDKFTLNIPSARYGNFELSLHKAEVFSSGFKVTLSSGKKAEGDVGIHYSGVINGDLNSIVAISIYEDCISGIISNHTGNFNLGKIKDNEKYVLYSDRDYKSDRLRSCGVIDSHFPYEMPTRDAIGERRAKTVLVYAEGDYDLLQQLGSVSTVTNYLTTILSQGIILFQNDGIDTKVNELKIWDTASPYVPGPDDYKADDYLVTFRNTYKNGFNGNVAILMTSQSIGGGLAADIGGICKSDKSLSMAVTDLKGDVKNVPEYSWDVSVWVHEIGHLLGSRHTHACVWNGNNTQIDDCASVYQYNKGASIQDLEGGACFDPNNPILPANGGFIMSYCDFIETVGTNLSLGFGQQSGNVIRNAIANCIGGGQGEDLSASPNPLVFTDKGGCLNLDIISKNPWQIGYDPKYPPYFLTKLPPSNGSGNATVELCASQNTLPLLLGFPLYITDGTNTIEVKVRQEAIKDPTALFFPGDKTIAKAEGDFVNIDILTNTDWKLIQNAYDTWVVIKSTKSGTTNAKFNLEVLKNSTGLNRYAKIGLVYNNGLDTTYFTVSQPSIGSGYINVPSDFSAGSYENTYSFNVYSDLEWEITDISGGWMDPSPKKGKGNGTVLVKIAANGDPNERNGTLTFTAKLAGGDIVKTIKINQLQQRSEESPNQVKVFPNPASNNLNIQLSSRSESPLQITLVSSDGKAVKYLEKGKSIIGNYSKEFDLSGISSGYYTLIMQYDNQVKREKIIIIQ